MGDVLVSGLYALAIEKKKENNLKTREILRYLCRAGAPERKTLKDCGRYHGPILYRELPYSKRKPLKVQGP
jgi:hypothetical protein